MGNSKSKLLEHFYDNGWIKQQHALILLQNDYSLFVHSNQLGENDRPPPKDSMDWAVQKLLMDGIHKKRALVSRYERRLILMQYLIGKECRNVRRVVRSDDVEVVPAREKRQPAKTTDVEVNPDIISLIWEIIKDQKEDSVVTYYLLQHPHVKSLFKANNLADSDKSDLKLQKIVVETFTATLESSSKEQKIVNLLKYASTKGTLSDILVVILYLYLFENTFEYTILKETITQFCSISFMKEKEAKVENKPPSPEELERQTSALILQEITGIVELDVCYKALQLSRDNLEQAANLLFENRDRVVQQIRREEEKRIATQLKEQESKIARSQQLGDVEKANEAMQIRNSSNFSSLLNLKFNAEGFSDKRISSNLLLFALLGHLDSLFVESKCPLKLKESNIQLCCDYSLISAALLTYILDQLKPYSQSKRFSEHEIGYLGSLVFVLLVPLCSKNIFVTDVSLSNSIIPIIRQSLEEFSRSTEIESISKKARATWKLLFPLLYSTADARMQLLQKILNEETVSELCQDQFSTFYECLQSERSFLTAGASINSLDKDLFDNILQTLFKLALTNTNNLIEKAAKATDAELEEMIKAGGISSSVKDKYYYASLMLPVLINNVLLLELEENTLNFVTKLVSLVISQTEEELKSLLKLDNSQKTTKTKQIQHIVLNIVRGSCIGSVFPQFLLGICVFPTPQLLYLIQDVQTSISKVSSLALQYLLELDSFMNFHQEEQKKLNRQSEKAKTTEDVKSESTPLIQKSNASKEVEDTDKKKKQEAFPDPLNFKSLTGWFNEVHDIVVFVLSVMAKTQTATCELPPKDLTKSTEDELNKTGDQKDAKENNAANRLNTIRSLVRNTMVLKSGLSAQSNQPLLEQFTSGASGIVSTWINENLKSIVGLFLGKPNQDLILKTVSNVIAALLYHNCGKKFLSELIQPPTEDHEYEVPKWVATIFSSWQIARISREIYSQKMQNNVPVEDSCANIISKCKFLFDLNVEEKTEDFSDEPSILDNELSKSILSFVKCSHSIDDIILFFNHQNEVCNVRTTGLNSFLDICSIKYLSPIVFGSILKQISVSFDQESTSNHLFDGLEGMSPESKMKLHQSWSALYTLLASIFNKSKGQQLSNHLLVWSIRISNEDVPFLRQLNIFESIKVLLSDLHFRSSIPEVGSLFDFQSLKNRLRKPKDTNDCYDLSVLVLTSLLTQMTSAYLKSKHPSTEDQLIFSVLDEEIQNGLDGIKDTLKVKNKHKDAEVDTHQLVGSAEKFVQDKNGIEFNDVIVPPDPNRYSFSLWMYSSDSVNQNRSVFFRGTTDNYVSLILGKSQKLEYHHTNILGDRYVLVSHEIIPVRCWIHVVCSTDGTNMTLYINGNLSGTKQVKNAPMGPNTPATKGTVFIGKGSALGCGLNGYICDFKYMTSSIATASPPFLFSCGTTTQAVDSLSFELLTLYSKILDHNNLVSNFSRPSFLKLLLKGIRVGTPRIKNICLSLLRKVLKSATLPFVNLVINSQILENLGWLFLYTNYTIFKRNVEPLDSLLEEFPDKFFTTDTKTKQYMKYWLSKNWNESSLVLDFVMFFREVLSLPKFSEHTRNIIFKWLGDSGPGWEMKALTGFSVLGGVRDVIRVGAKVKKGNKIGKIVGCGQNHYSANVLFDNETVEELLDFEDIELLEEVEFSPKDIPFNKMIKTKFEIILEDIGDKLKPVLPKEVKFSDNDLSKSGNDEPDKPQIDISLEKDEALDKDNAKDVKDNAKEGTKKKRPKKRILEVKKAEEKKKQESKQRIFAFQEKEMSLIIGLSALQSFLSFVASPPEGELLSVKLIKGITSLASIPLPKELSGARNLEIHLSSLLYRYSRLNRDYTLKSIPLPKNVPPPPPPPMRSTPNRTLEVPPPSQGSRGLPRGLPPRGAPGRSSFFSELLRRGGWDSPAPEEEQSLQNELNLLEHLEQQQFEFLVEQQRQLTQLSALLNQGEQKTESTPPESKEDDPNKDLYDNSWDWNNEDPLRPRRTSYLFPGSTTSTPSEPPENSFSPFMSNILRPPLRSDAPKKGSPSKVDRRVVEALFQRLNRRFPRSWCEKSLEIQNMSLEKAAEFLLNSSKEKLAEFLVGDWESEREENPLAKYQDEKLRLISKLKKEKVENLDMSEEAVLLAEINKYLEASIRKITRAIFLSCINYFPLQIEDILKEVDSRIFLDIALLTLFREEKAKKLQIWNCYWSNSITSGGKNSFTVLLDECCSHLMKISEGEDFITSDENANDEDVLSKASLSFVSWVIALFQECMVLDDVSLENLLFWLTQVLKSPLLTANEMGFNLLCSVLTTLPQEKQIKIVDTLPYKTIKSVAEKRIARERRSGVLHVTSKYLSSMINLLGILKTIKSTKIDSLPVTLRMWVSKKTGSSILLNWELSDKTNLETFTLELSVPTGDATKTYWIMLYDGTDCEYHITGLEPSQECRIRLRAILKDKTKITDKLIVVTDGSPISDFKFSPDSQGNRYTSRTVISNNGKTFKKESRDQMVSALVNVKLSTGLHYWEVRIDSAEMRDHGNIWIGVVDANNYHPKNLGGWGISNAREARDISADIKRIFGTRFISGVIGVLLDLDRDTVQFYHDGRNLGNSFHHALLMSGKTLSPVIGFFKDPNTQVTLTDNTYSIAGTSEKKEMFDILGLINTINQLSLNKKIPKTFLSDVYNNFLDWYYSDTHLYVMYGGDEHPNNPITLEINRNPFHFKDYEFGPDDVVTTSKGDAVVLGVSGDYMWFTPVEQEKKITKHYVANQSWYWPLPLFENPANVLSIVTKVDKQVLGLEGIDSASFDALLALPSWCNDLDNLLVSALNHLSKEECGVLLSSSTFNWAPFNVSATKLWNYLENTVEETIKSKPQFKSIAIARTALIRTINFKIQSLLSYIDWNKKHLPWNISHQIHKNKNLFFYSTKLRALNSSLYATQFFPTLNEDEFSYPQQCLTIEIDRRAMAKHSARHAKSDLDPIRFSIFGQTYVALKGQDDRKLKQSTIFIMDAGQKRAFRVKLKGEGVDDHGGPYSQLFTDICLELQRINEDGTPFLPLFVPSPNNVSGQGLNQEKFVINPILPPEDTHLRLDYYRFFGKLMGMAIRTNIPLPLDLPSLFWKRLVNDPVNLSDLEEIDHATTKLIKELKSLSQESFEARYSDNPLYFMVQLGNDEVYDLIQHGRHVTVNYKNLTEFIDKLSQFHLTTSIERQLSAIVSGLETIIPVDCLNVFTPQELQIVVCGSPEINIAMLKERAIYEDVNPSEPHIDYFWQVLEEFDTEKRCQFLQFVWARTRIPASGLSMNLKIQRSRKDFPDHFLPTTQTCFFSISLPTYSSIEVTRKQLLYAITHCADMDNDILLH